MSKDISDRGRVVIADALYNLHLASGSDSVYARGVLVGVVSGLMGSGMTFDDALALCSLLTPKVIIAGSVPRSWMSQFHIGLRNESNPARPTWIRTEGRPVV